jgi:SAM-dependent methyltransferase
MPKKDMHESNRLSWNQATRAHNSHKHDQAGFFRRGGSTLFAEEIDLLGDISGQHVVHLQCNAGQDTLSLALRGAVVTGVDISDEAVTFARQLSAESGVPAQFFRQDVYDWLEQTAPSDTRFDVAFSSYGAMPWLSDLSTWAKGIAAILKPGGRFVLVEFHPFGMLFEEDWRLTYDYMGGKVEKFDEGIGDYVAYTGSVTGSDYVEGVVDFKNPHPAYEFSWGIADTVTAMIDAGLRIAALREYPYANGFRPYPDMRELPGRRFAMPEGMPDLPLMFGLVAHKPAD